MSSQKSLQHFITLLDQYKQVAFPSLIGKTSPSATLDLLETVDHVKSIPDQQVIDILVQGCKTLGYQDILSRPFCQFMYKQLSKQIRSTTSFRPAQFDTCIKYLMDGVDSVQIQDKNEYRVDLLRALGALVFENATNTQRHMTRISKLLLNLADRSTKSLEIRRMAINCIGNTCAGGGMKLQPLYKDFYACLLGNVCAINHTTQGTIMVASTSLDFTDTAVRKVASSTLRSLQFLLAQDKSLVTNPLCDIVEIIYTFIFMHVSVPAYSGGASPFTINLRRNRLSQPNASATTASLPFSWRTPIKHQSTVTSSESELSDSQSSSSSEISPRRQRDNAKIRINALLCLSAIAATSPKALYPHWHKFIPDTFSIFLSNNSISNTLSPIFKSDNQPYSLFTVLLYDPMINVRAAVCNTLVAMLDGSKQYLSLALESDEKSKSSFTSLSEKLGSIIHDLHQGLIYALSKEQSTQVLILLFHVATILIENCSYERLSKKHLPALYQAIMTHWSQISLRTYILKVLTSLLSASSQKEADDFTNRYLLEALTTGGDETWRVCAILIKTSDLWQKLKPHFHISVASLKFAESYASTIEVVTEVWWQEMMECYLQSACSNELAAVRAAACDCFASMAKEIFENFHYRYQRLAVTLLFSLVQDTDANVRAAACRALGVFVLFPSLREDALFVSDMTRAILSQKDDKAILVRVRASWAIGNLCDALVLESERQDFMLREFMSTTEWIEILSTATLESLDSDKLRSNAVRAIGSLLRITPQEYYENTRIMSLVKNAMDGLVKNIESGSLKTRWNACHATSNMLRNTHFPIGFIPNGEGIYPWTTTLYQALIHALIQCKNFKVRINACLAMTTPTRQEQYGDKVTLIVKSILDAWEICQQNQEYKEIKYKNQLEKQIIESLNRLQNWIPEDFKQQVNEIHLEYMTLEE